MEGRTLDIMKRNLKRRYAAERRFRLYGLASIVMALLFMLMLFTAIIGAGHSAFVQTAIKLQIHLIDDAFPASPDGDDAYMTADYTGMIKQALRSQFPEVTSRGDKRALYRLISPGAGYSLRDHVLEDTKLVGSTIDIWLPADDDVDMFVKGHFDEQESPSGRLSGIQAGWIAELQQQGRIATHLNTTFLTAGDSREPELSGIRGALVGSFLTLLVTLVLSFPIGVGAAIYLEEFAPRNRWTDLIEVNVNNLAAVPSIVFGLLGLAVFINFFGVPRSAPLAGGLVLTLMTLPTIIISSRAILKAVPPSIREAALGVGASKVQMVFHHVVPQALPGMLTGTIIGMGQALGESAPLLMIGMVAFIVDIPGGIL
ncbi:MAG: PstA family ABC transporter permease, partial [Thiohalobacterales bacterium]|nr:PstA family ABC transporter permease [Thiohalobacterales bacterium]